MIVEGRCIGTEGDTEIWLRKATPGSEKPAGPKRAIQFPFLADGELLGVLQFATEGHDRVHAVIAVGDRFVQLVPRCLQLLKCVVLVLASFGIE